MLTMGLSSVIVLSCLISVRGSTPRQPRCCSFSAREYEYVWQLAKGWMKLRHRHALGLGDKTLSLVLSAAHKTCLVVLLVLLYLPSPSMGRIG